LCEGIGEGVETGGDNEILIYILANRLYKSIMGRTGIGKRKREREKEETDKLLD
jgi:hypothetical protein